MEQENSFVMLGQLRKQMKSKNWTSAEIEKVLNDATSGDRDHLEDVVYQTLTKLENENI
jgi:hypothetical protein